MEIYLPVAEMSVHWLTILGMAAAVGYLSGLLGVGGAFLLTPLLIFYGIPPTVAVATTASHLTASSMSGAIAQWRRRAVDFKMAGVMLCGGFVGSAVGVYLFGLLHRIGQTEIVVSVGYVILLGTGGGFVLVPAMIYVLRMPTNIVIGTSLTQIVCATAATTLLQSVNNFSVDIV